MAAQHYQSDIDARLDKVIKAAEASRARIHEIAGRSRENHLSQDVGEQDKQLCSQLAKSILVDEDYSVLGSHLDSLLRKKIIEHEYVDFARLLPRDRVKIESDNRMEMVQQNRQTYWIPYTNRDNLNISSYHKWKLAFRVFSNVYTAAHPARATELLQYHHLICSASQNYVWDNVYMYDIDFRIHKSNHPDRSWVAILQQAWSFHLKDRLTHFSSRSSKDKSQGVNSVSRG